MKWSSLLPLLLFSAFFANAQSRHHHHRFRGEKIAIKACNNEITAAIPSVTAVNGFGGIGIGLDYVRYLDKEGFFSVNVGVRAAKIQDYLFLGGGDSEEFTDGDALYVMPGLQCHPFSNHHKVNYAVGIAVPLGSEHTTFHGSSYRGRYTTTTSNAIAGVALTNDVSFNNPRHSNFVFGIHVAIGYTILNSETSTFFQFGIKLGGRF